MMASAAGAGSSSSSLDRLNSALKRIKYRSVILSKVKNDWKFLRKLWKSAHKRREAGTDEEKNSVDICLKIEGTAEEISQELTRFRTENMVDDHWECGRKTQRLIAEVEKALNRLYLMWSSMSSTGGSSSSSSSSSFVFDASFCKDLLVYVRSTVIAIQTMTADHWGYEDEDVRIHFRSLYYNVTSINYYLVSFFGAPRFSGSGATTDDVLHHTLTRYHARGLPSFDACVGHVLSVALRIANWCSDCWLNCEAGQFKMKKGQLIELLVLMHNEIHPSNPKFMGFHLNFLMALSCAEMVAFNDFLRSFCDYLFCGEDGHFRHKVFSLSQLFLYTTSILDNEDTAGSFIPEIRTVLAEMASIFESTGRNGKELDNSPRCSELLTKICLLEAELFLLVQIHSMKSNRNTSSPSSSILPDFEDIMNNCRQIPKSLPIYSKKLPRETRLHRKKLLALIESTFEEEMTLYESSRRKEITACTAKNSLLLLRFKIVIFKGELFLRELFRLMCGNYERLMAHEKDQKKLLLQKLEYIALILSDERIKDGDVLEAIGESFRRLTCFSFYFLNTQREMLNLSISELLDKAKRLTKAKLTEVVPKFPKFDFPKTSTLNFIDFLWRNLKELLKYNPASTPLPKHHTEEIQKHLQSLRSFLKKVSQLDIEKRPELEDLIDRVTDSAYRAEYIIDSIEIDAQWQDFFWLDNVLEELRLLSEKARGIHLTTPIVEVQDSKNVTQVSLDWLSRNSTPAKLIPKGTEKEITA